MLHCISIEGLRQAPKLTVGTIWVSFQHHFLCARYFCGWCSKGPCTPAKTIAEASALGWLGHAPDTYLRQSLFDIVPKVP